MVWMVMLSMIMFLNFKNTRLVTWSIIDKPSIGMGENVVRNEYLWKFGYITRNIHQSKIGIRSICIAITNKRIVICRQSEYFVFKLSWIWCIWHEQMLAIRDVWY